MEVNMRITRIKLENFAGVYQGSGKTEIEILFPDNKKLITMFNGRNGSGKTCIMSQLHPYKDSFDERRNLIIDDCTGRKEIDIANGNDIFKITHTYCKKAQSFIKKNGVELNENGGVRTFNDIITTEFGLTPDYFKIGKIGSNTTNFIQFTAAERKTFISKFLPDIEDYLDKFDVVKDKFKDINLNLKSILEDLGKLESEESIKIKIGTAENIQKNTDIELENLSAEIALVNSDIDRLIVETNVDTASMHLALNAKRKRIEEIREAGRIFFEKYKENKSNTELQDHITLLDAKFIKLSEDLARNLANKENLNIVIVDSENKLQKKKFKLKEFEISSGLAGLRERAEKNKKELAEKKSKCGGLYDPSLETESEFLSSINSFNNLCLFIYEHYRELNESDLSISERNFQFILDDANREKITRLKNTSRKIIQEKQDILENKLLILHQKNANVSKLLILEKRPIECNNNMCPFIKDALQYKNLPNEISLLESEIKLIRNDISDLEKRAEEIVEIDSISKSFFELYEKMNVRKNTLFSYYVSNFGKIELSTQTNTSDNFKKNFQSLVETAQSDIERLNSIRTLEKDLENLDYQIAYLANIENSKDEIQIDIIKIEEDLVSLKSKQIEINEICENLVLEKAVVGTELSDNQNFLNGKIQFQATKDAIDNLVLNISDIAESKEKLISKQTALKSLQFRQSDFRIKKTAASSDFIQLQNQLIRVKDLKQKEKDFSENFENIKTIKESLDPNRGIPLYFIKSYLEKTRDIANNLLQLAFKNLFEIDFVTNSSEFFIRVRTGESVKNDIVEASQGEVALTTISISLALIEQSLGKFNVLFLDEIDGPLDASNRANFINIIETQAAKLGIEQIFVISHNDVFDLCSSNLILLDGYTINETDEEYLKNKKIIYKI